MHSTVLVPVLRLRVRRTIGRGKRTAGRGKRTTGRGKCASVGGTSMGGHTMSARNGARVSVARSGATAFGDFVYCAGRPWHI